MKKNLFALCTFLILLSTAYAQTQTQTQSQPVNRTPCADSAEHRRFDFWVGEWDVFGPKGKQAGTSSIQKILDGCVILENWTGGSGYTGKSFNLYNSVSKQWEQIWVDNQGSILKFSGNFSGDELRYSGRTQQSSGSFVEEKLTFFNKKDGTVRQLWEQSSDGGKTWNVIFDGTYKKRAK